MPGKRMTFNQRVKLQTYLEDPRCKSISYISKVLKLNRVTVYQEILNRRISRGSKQLKFMKTKPLPCELLHEYPFCCNTCFKKDRCAKEIFIYDAYEAHKMFSTIKHECAAGPRITTKELRELDEIVSPRIQSGQSLYHVVASDNKIRVSEITVRRYLKKGYLQAKPIDLPRTVQRKSNDIVYEKRTHVDVKLLSGRMYDDYLSYIRLYPFAKIIQIDTMIGKRKDKKCILTIFEPTSKLQIGILVSRNAEAINSALLDIINVCKTINVEFFDTIVTDNGSEFQLLPNIELDEMGVYRFKLFYCDPYASYQKGGCERNHEFFRYIKRKGISFDSLSQFELDDIFSNINSYKRKSLNGLTPYEVFKSRYGLKLLEALHIHIVEPHKVILKQ